MKKLKKKKFNSYCIELNWGKKKITSWSFPLSSFTFCILLAILSYKVHVDGTLYMVQHFDPWNIGNENTSMDLNLFFFCPGTKILPLTPFKGRGLMQVGSNLTIYILSKRFYYFVTNDTSDLNLFFLGQKMTTSSS